MSANRKMPRKVNLGRGGPTVIGMAMLQREEYKAGGTRCKEDGRVVMGYKLPKWQRPLVWSDIQNESFIRSVWLGIPIGTWTFNRSYDRQGLDNLLIDGQQRMNAIERYLDDAFPVFGYRWSETTCVDKRVFKGTVFPSYTCETNDEQYLRDYYNLMNFGGTAHTEDQKA